MLCQELKPTLKECDNLDNVLLVKGITSNLISISQLCDQGMDVNFNKSECLVTDEKGKVLMRGIKSKENCHLWIPLEKIQIGKQTRMLHTRLEYQEISKGLQLLHMVSTYNRESTSEGRFALGNNQISLFGEKTYCGVLPTSEAEYIAAGRSCPQSVWMKQMLNDYNVEQDVPTFRCFNLSTINILKSTIQYSRTKHIDVKFHSIRDLVEEKVVTLEHVATTNN